MRVNYGSLRRVAVVFVVLHVSAAVGAAAPKPVPSSPYLGYAYRYADAMLAHGRDTHGTQKTGLLLSALDRKTLTLLTERPAAPAGVAESLRAGEKTGPLTGADVQHDENLLRLLYTLSDLSSKPMYRDAADAELKWLLRHPSPGKPTLPAWDEQAAWNTTTDTPIHRAIDRPRGPIRGWMLWDRCFELEPAASAQMVLGLRDIPSAPSARSDGFSIRALATAYDHTRDEDLLKAIEADLERLPKLEHAQVGFQTSAGSAGHASAADWLSAAIDCGGAARRVPASLAARLGALAARMDQAFCALPHDLSGHGGFALARRSADDKSGSKFTPLWSCEKDGHTTAQVAMMCVARYENTGDVRYRELVRAAAEAYRDSLPPENIDAWPMTFGHAICLELAAWRSTSRQEYLDAAIKLADAAVRTFWEDGSLPRASSKSQHYESITGGDTLALALVELHLHILGITAVRSPPNTIDR